MNPLSSPAVEPAPGAIRSRGLTCALRPAVIVAAFYGTIVVALLAFVLAPALLMLGWAAGVWRGPGDACVWAAALNALLVLWLPPGSTEILWHSAPLASAQPRLWRALAALFAVSAFWTVALALRYVLWDVAFW